jgi:CRP/FNR family transcriptional regulator, cyclic AMP receptor protein
MGGSAKRHAEGRKVDALAGMRLFGACSREQLTQIAHLFEETARPAGSVLVREGDPGSEFFVILDGAASASVGDELVRTLGPGDFFGEMSLLERAPRSATITAETDLDLLVMDARSFSSLVEAAPSVGVRMMRTMTERLRSVEAPATIS